MKIAPVALFAFVASPCPVLGRGRTRGSFAATAPKAATPPPTEAPPPPPANSGNAQTNCAKENEPCFDMDTLTYTKCCANMQRHVDRSENGDFSAKCASSDVVSASINAKSVVSSHKDVTCYQLEDTLDSYYKEICTILDQIDAEPSEQELGLAVAFLCENMDPTNPGCRDLASYARFDFIEKCSQWDAARCELKLAEAVRDGELLYRKLQGKTITYASGDVSELASRKANGFVAEFDCDVFEYPPFLHKHLPFDPRRLNKTCGDAGYEYYVE